MLCLSMQAYLFLIAPILLANVVAADLAPELPDNYSNVAIGQIGRFVEMQLFAAPVNATTPTMDALPFRLLTWGQGFYKLGLCARADVYKCLRYGELLARGP